MSPLCGTSIQVVVYIDVIVDSLEVMVVIIMCLSSLVFKTVTITLFHFGYLTLTQASFLKCVFLTGLGMVLYYTGGVIDVVQIYKKVKEEYQFRDDDIPWWLSMEFAGAVIATFFMVSSSQSGFTTVANRNRN